MPDTIDIIIPPPLRSKVGDQEMVQISASSVGNALEILTTTYPATKPLLFHGDGTVNKFIGLYLNDENVKFMDDLKTKLQGGDELVILAAIPGGN